MDRLGVISKDRRGTAGQGDPTRRRTAGWTSIGAVLLSGIAILVALAGCHLIDQTSFGGAPHAPAPAETSSAFASRGKPPLLIIELNNRSIYSEALRQAIGTAEARNGDVRFRLEAVVPAQGSADAQAAALNAGQSAAREILDEMGRDGIEPGRVTLSARTDPHAQRSELRLLAG